MFWLIIEIERKFKTTYHPQYNVHVELYNQAILGALGMSVYDHFRNWYFYAVSLTFDYKIVS